MEEGLRVSREKSISGDSSKHKQCSLKNKKKYSEAAERVNYLQAQRKCTYYFDMNAAEQNTFYDF